MLISRVRFGLNFEPTRHAIPSLKSFLSNLSILTAEFRLELRELFACREAFKGAQLVLWIIHLSVLEMTVINVEEVYQVSVLFFNFLKVYYSSFYVNFPLASKYEQYVNHPRSHDSPGGRSEWKFTSKSKRSPKCSFIYPNLSARKITKGKRAEYGYGVYFKWKQQNFSYC